MLKVNLQHFAGEKAQNLLSGAEGEVVLDGDVLAYVKSVDANVEKVKAERRVVGKRNTLHKAVGWNGTGTLVVYKYTSLFRQKMLDYIKNGVDFYPEIQITNQDPTATDIGKEINVISGVNFDSVNVGMLNPDDEILEEEMPFTFEDYDLSEKFDL